MIKLHEVLLFRLFQEKLNSKPCQNQGYIIDGYPKSKKQAASLFSRKFRKNNIAINNKHIFCYITMNKKIVFLVFLDLI